MRRCLPHCPRESAPSGSRRRPTCRATNPPSSCAGSPMNAAAAGCSDVLATADTRVRVRAPEVSSSSGPPRLLDGRAALWKSNRRARRQRPGRGQRERAGWLANGETASPFLAKRGEHDAVVLGDQHHAAVARACRSRRPHVVELTHTRVPASPASVAAASGSSFSVLRALGGGFASLGGALALGFALGSGLVLRFLVAAGYRQGRHRKPHPSVRRHGPGLPQTRAGRR